MLGLIPPSPADKTMFLVPHSAEGEIATLTNAFIFEKSMYFVQAACCRRASGTEAPKFEVTMTCPRMKREPFFSELQN